MSIYPGRDIIELPLVDDWDTNGWDIKKALALMLKPNPVLLEWMSSPIHYIWNDPPTQRLWDLAHEVVQPTACIAHYFHLGHDMWRRNIANATDGVKLRKYFYSIRPALALRWVRMHPDKLPPMNFQELVNATEVSEPVLKVIHELLEQKAKTKELGKGPRIDLLDDLMRSEYDWAEANKPKPPPTNNTHIERANQVFREIVRGEWT